jgi:hypothetical protein
VTSPTVVILLFISVMFTMAVVATIWMVQHDRKLPRLMLAFHVVQAAGFLYIFSLSTGHPPSDASNAYQDGQAMGRFLNVTFLVLRCLIWMAYFSSSKRVKQTFIQG